MIIQVADICFRYDAHPVLQDVHFTANAGEVLGIVGPNGSGKSTLLKVMSKALTPHSGTILLNEEPINHYPRRRIAQLMAVIQQQETVAFDFTVYDVVLMGRHPHLSRFSNETTADLHIVESAMQQAGINHLAKRRISQLSGGERQRVALARALAQQTPVLLLDEPTSNLDLKYQVQTLSILRQLAASKHTIVVVLHELNLASQFCDHLLLLCAGSIVKAGTPAEVLQETLLQEVYGLPTLVTTHPHTGRPVVLPSVLATNTNQGGRL